MIRILYFFIILVFLLGLAPDSSSQSPFQTPSQEQSKKQEQAFSVGNLFPGWIQDLGQKAMARIITWQAHLRQKAGTYARQIRENPWGSAFWSYLVLAFGYGVVHALGPGHGKVFVSTYFLSRRGSVRQGLLMGGLMSFLHVLSAVVLVFVFYFLLKAGGLGSVEDAGRHMQKISAGLICLVGLVMAWKSIRAILHGHTDKCGCCSSGTDNKNMLSLCLAVGLIPCPGAALILFFSITLDILTAGLLAMIFLASGLALTTISFALASLFARNMLAKATTKAPVSPRLYHAPALLGAIFITFLGAVLYFNPLI